MVFMMCNRGLAQLIGAERVKAIFGRRRLKCGDEFELDVVCRSVRLTGREGT